MSLNKTVQEALSNLTSLKRVRLKVDPKDSTLADFTKLNGYEGYILEEHPEDDTIDVYVTTNDQPECMDDHIFTGVPIRSLSASIIIPLTPSLTSIKSLEVLRLPTCTSGAINPFFIIAN